MFSIHRILLPLASLTLCSLTALAQTSTDEPHLEEMVITASRTEKPVSAIPNTVTTIDRVALQQQLSVNHDLSTVLGNLIPGFSPSRQKMSNSGETLRGRSPLYLIDGVPQSNPLRDGARDGVTIDPAMIERIEVIHGANAVHGMGASGGIINLITKKPGDQRQQSISVDMTTPSDSRSDALSGGLAYNFADTFAGGWDLLASVSARRTGIYTDANGEVIGVDGAQGDTMDSDSRDIFIKAGYRGDNHSVHLMVNDFNLEGNDEWIAIPGDYAAGQPTTSVEGDVDGIPPTNDVRTISLDYRARDIWGHSVHAQLFSQDFAATYGGGYYATFQDPAYGPDLFDQSENQSEKHGIKLTLARDSIADLPLGIVWGLDALRDETQQILAQTGRAWVPPTRYENIAPFAQLEFTGIDRLVLTTGVRYEDSTLEVDDFTSLASYGSQAVTGGSPSFTETLYNLGFTYAFTDKLRLFGNLAEGSSMADVGRVLRGISQPNVRVDDFLNLQPVISDNREMGVAFTSPTLTAEISYYQSNSDYGSRLAMNADGIFDVERERTEMAGVEASAEWFFSADASVGFAYARPEGEYDSDGDNRVDTDLDGANITPPRLNLFWSQQWTEALSTRLQASRLMDRHYRDASGESFFHFAGYTLVDFTATWELGSSMIHASLQNLTDEDYYTLFAQNRKSDNHMFKGRGRTLSLGYRYHF